jgi:myosin heavy subunit
MLCCAVQDIDGVDDAAEFSEVMEALSDIGVQQHEIDMLLRTLSGILWLGNLKIEPVHANDSSKIKADSALTNSAQLLGLSEQDLSHAITHKKVRQGSETGCADLLRVVVQCTAGGVTFLRVAASQGQIKLLHR